jgi:hypothetical protein
LAASPVAAQQQRQQALGKGGQINIRSFQTTASYVFKKWLRLSATKPWARTPRATDGAPRFRDRVPRLERAPPTDRAPGPELVPAQAVVLAPPPFQFAGRFRLPTNCATDKQGFLLIAADQSA